VLTKADGLRASGVGDVAFASKDRHLQPWTRDGQRVAALADLYDSHRIWVFGDFSLAAPAPSSAWFTA
jgi:hypothetical protein